MLGSQKEKFLKKLRLVGIAVLDALMQDHDPPQVKAFFSLGAGSAVGRQP